MKTSRFLALLCTLFIYIGAAFAQPFTFQNRLYDYMLKYYNYGYCAPGESRVNGVNQPMTIYLSEYGQVTIALPDKVLTSLISDCHSDWGLLGCDIVLTGENFKLTFMTTMLGSLTSFQYQGAYYVGGETDKVLAKQMISILDLANDGKFLKGTGGAPLTPEASEAQARARHEAELREQERKARAEAEAARLKAIEEEMRRRQEEEARFRAQPLSARTDAVRVPEVLASFPYGEAMLDKYLQENLKYPAIAQEEGIQGTVIVQFIVERDGSFSSVEVVKSPDPSFKKEAIRLIKSMPRWYPAFSQGSPVPSVVTHPIRFKL